MNATRHAILEAVRAIVPVWSWTGGRTKWNRVQLGLPKMPALDALGVGAIAGVSGCGSRCWASPPVGMGCDNEPLWMPLDSHLGTAGEPRRCTAFVREIWCVQTSQRASTAGFIVAGRPCEPRGPYAWGKPMASRGGLVSCFSVLMGMTTNRKEGRRLLPTTEVGGLRRRKV